MIKIQKIEKKNVSSFAVNCNFSKVKFVGFPAYYKYISGNIIQIINSKIKELTLGGKLISLKYSISNDDIDDIKIIADGDITLDNTQEYFNMDNGIRECRLDIRYYKAFPPETLNATLNVEVYMYDDAEEYVQNLSGQLEIDDNAVPRPKEIYHDFGISDAYVKLDSSAKNQGFKSNSEDLYAVILQDRLYAVMRIKRIREIVNDKLEKVTFTDNSDALYSGKIVADIYADGAESAYMSGFNKGILNGRKMCDKITYSNRINNSLLKTRIRFEEAKGIFFEELDMREYVSLICEIYDSTVSIDNAALRFMAR